MVSRRSWHGIARRLLPLSRNCGRAPGTVRWAARVPPRRACPPSGAGMTWAGPGGEGWPCPAVPLRHRRAVFSVRAGSVTERAVAVNGVSAPCRCVKSRASESRRHDGKGMRGARRNGGRAGGGAWPRGRAPFPARRPGRGLIPLSPSVCFPSHMRTPANVFPRARPRPGRAPPVPLPRRPGGHSADVRRIVIRQDLKWSLFAVRGAVAGVCRAPFRRDLGRVRPRRGGAARRRGRGRASARFRSKPPGSGTATRRTGPGILAPPRRVVLV
jgi:hypothetical protein